MADNLASNGVVHIIDTVMLPPADDLEVQEPTDVLQVHDEPTKNIVELAQSVDTLSTLVAAVVAGELAETLSSPGNFTVFAPNDAAFAALPTGTLESLLKPENRGQLVDILTYHVLPSQVLSTDLKLFQRVDTLEGKEVHVASLSLGGDAKLVKVGSRQEAAVIGADNLASNGVVHIIDIVMLPLRMTLKCKILPMFFKCKMGQRKTLWSWRILWTFCPLLLQQSLPANLQRR